MSTATGKKAKRRNNNILPNQPQLLHPSQAELAPQTSHIPSIATTNEELNLSVLRRYWPDIFTVIHISPYAVLYLFNPHTQTWEKVGIEGTLFVVLHKDLHQLFSNGQEEERFSVTILNRRGMDNFSAPLLTPDDVDVTDQYIIIKESDDIYGLWIFSEPPPSSTAHAREATAHVILECAKRAQASREALLAAAAEQPVAQEVDAYGEENALGVPLGRTMSLREIVGEQRVQDAAFSVHEHHPPVPSHAPSQAQPSNKSLFMKNPDTEFFHSGTTPVSSKTSSQQKPPPSTAPKDGISLSVDDLFARARKQG